MIHDTGVEIKSDALQGVRVAFGICGGIGAVETVKILRELRRHGAQLTVFATPAALKFITELSLKWAAQGPILQDPGADVEHLEPFDIAVLAPLTLNTLTKCALGITDSAVSLMVAGQVGRKAPLVCVPTMNLQLQKHPLYAKYVAQLETWGARFFPSPEEEGRLKMPAADVFSKWLIEVYRGN